MIARRPSPWCRKLLPNDRAAAARHGVVVDRMLDALASSDAAALRRVMHSDATLLVDSGGRTTAPGAAVRGREAVAMSLIDTVGGHRGMSGAAAAVNGLPGLALRSDGRVVAVVAVRVRRCRAAEVWVVMSPEKLRRWNRS